MTLGRLRHETVREIICVGDNAQKDHLVALQCNDIIIYFADYSGIEKMLRCFLHGVYLRKSYKDKALLF